MDLALQRAAAVEAQSEVLRTADDLRAERDRISGRVDRLLTEGWTGVAAGQYADGWQEWCSGADEVLRALTTLGDLMGSVRESLIETDGQSAAASSALVSRLGPLP